MPEPPPGFPREVAAGEFADGGRWALSETGLGQVCVRVVNGDSHRSGCTELTTTWLVGTLRLTAADETVQIVYAGLPCGVASAELRQDGERLDTAATVAYDDVSYVALRGPATLDGVELVARGRTGSELFRVDRLNDDLSSRVPHAGC